MPGFDAVFVGSGINSLAGAALLAKDGWRVCVLERNDWLGGAIKTVEGLTAPGFTHEVFSSWHPLWVGSPAYAELKPDLDRLGLEYLNTDLPTATAFPDGSSAFLSTDGAANVAELGEAWQRQFDQFMAGADDRVRRARHASSGRGRASRSAARPTGSSAGAASSSSRATRCSPARDWLTRHVRRRAGARPARAVGAPHRARPRPGDVRLHDAGDRVRAPARRDAGADGRRREARRRASPRSSARRAASCARRPTSSGSSSRKAARPRSGSADGETIPASRAVLACVTPTQLYGRLLGEADAPAARPRRRRPLPLRARRDADPHRDERAAALARRRAARAHAARSTSRPVSTASRGPSTRPTAACSRPRRRSRSASRWPSTPRARPTARG